MGAEGGSRQRTVLAVGNKIPTAVAEMRSAIFSIFGGGDPCQSFADGR